jgi:pentatricopeptide repeat protein
MNQPALNKIVTDLDALIRESENMEDIEKQDRPVEKMIHGCFKIGKLQAARDILKGLMDH